MDPLAEMQPNKTPYHYCSNNPVKRIDPTGMIDEDSTHTDGDGNVIAVVNDGDKGVYKHGKNADGKSPTQHQIEKRQKKHGTSAGGEKVGETHTELGFADFSAYEKDGTVQVAAGAKIDFDSTWATDKVTEALKSWDGSMVTYAILAKSDGPWNFKTDTPNDNISYGSLLFGKYASARDVGNMFAGMTEQMSLTPNLIIDYGYGLFNKSQNSIIKTAKNMIKDMFSDNKIGRVLDTAKNGEDKLSKAGIEAGKNYIKSLNKK